MRVGIVAPEFPPEIGGMQTYALEFSRELAALGHEVVVFTRLHGQGQALVPGLTVHPLLKERRRLDWNALRVFHFDVWHVMNASYAWLALETAPVIVSVHGNDFLRPYIPVQRPNLRLLPLAWRSRNWVPTLEVALGAWLTRRMVRKALPRAEHILANSQYTERVLLAHYPRCLGHTSIGSVGVSKDYLDFAPERHPSVVPRLITVCRLSERRKNVDLVLRALACLKDRYRFSYTVVGDGELRPELEALSHRLGLEDRVRFMGFVSSHELRNLLTASDLFILISSISPNSHEGFGIAYLEANACGTPVFAARLAGAVEAVKDGVSGMFANHPTVNDAARALERFFRGEVRFDPHACRAFALGFTWRKVVDCALRHYPKDRPEMTVREPVAAR